MASIQGVEQLAGAVGRVRPAEVSKPEEVNPAVMGDPDTPIRAQAAPSDSPTSSKRPELFDASEFAVGPTIDGQHINEIAFSVSGGVKFPGDYADAQDAFEAARLGKPVDLRIQAYVGAKQGSCKEDKEGNIVVSGKVTYKVISIELVAPEDL